jgi:hypothetical protein
MQPREFLVFGKKLFADCSQETWTGPSSNVSLAQFGCITSTRDPRILRFGLKLLFQLAAFMCNTAPHFLRKRNELSSTRLQLPIEDIPELDLEWGACVHLKSQDAFGCEVLRVLVDGDGHQLPVDELQEHWPTRDDVVRDVTPRPRSS